MLWKMLSAASKSNDANEEGQEAISTEEKTDVKNKEITNNISEQEEKKVTNQLYSSYHAFAPPPKLYI